MKQYTDQGKVDTRRCSLLGRLKVERGATFYIASCLIVLCASSCKFFAPFNPPEEKEKYFFQYSNECYIDGEREYRESWCKNTLDQIVPFYGLGGNTPTFAIRFGGFNIIDDNNIVLDYKRLFCIAALPVKGKFGNSLNFMIVGDGYGPFKTGVDYATSDNIVFYYPNILYSSEWRTINHYSIIYDYSLGSYSLRPMEHPSGISVKLLSSSFKFGYSKMDNDGISIDILDFYYDFEEVITSLPTDERDISLSIGDTVMVTNGHLRQAVSGIHEDKRINIKRLVSESSRLKK